MGQLTVLSGLPGSGKSTEADRRKDGHSVIVDRDRFRDSVTKSGTYTNEATLTQSMIVAVAQLLEDGFDVIVDAINLHPHDKIRWETVALTTHVRSTWIQLTTPVDECIRRDSLRPGSVGKERILEYAQTYRVENSDVAAQLSAV